MGHKSGQKKSGDEIFRIFRSLKSNHPISQFAVATKCVKDVHRFDFIQLSFNWKHNANLDFSRFKVTNMIITNRFENGLVKDLRRNIDIAGRAGLIASNIKSPYSQYREPMENYRQVASRTGVAMEG